MNSNVNLTFFFENIRTILNGSDAIDLYYYTIFKICRVRTIFTMI